MAKEIVIVNGYNDILKLKELIINSDLEFKVYDNKTKG